MPLSTPTVQLLVSLSKDVCEQRTSTGSGLLALLGNAFAQIFGQIVCIRVNTLSNTNLVVSRYIKSDKGSLLVEDGLKKLSPHLPTDRARPLTILLHRTI